MSTTTTTTTNMAGVDEMKNKLIFGWLLDYICHITWTEFSETLTMSSGTRDLIQGTLSRDICNDSNLQQTLLLTLLSRLADGSESYDMKYDEDSNVTVLEDMLHLFEQLARLQTEPLMKDGLDLITVIKSEAVMVSCRNNDFETAQNVFDRQWRDEKDKITGKMKEILKLILDSGQSDHEDLTKYQYSDFVRTMLAYLAKIQANLNTPLLLQAADKQIKTEKNGVEPPEDGMPVQSRSHGDSTFSADVIQSITADGDHNCNNSTDTPSKRKMRKLQNQCVDELFGETTPKTPKHASTPKASSSTSTPVTGSPDRKQSRKRDQHEPTVSSPTSKSSDIGDDSDDDLSITSKSMSALPKMRIKWTDEETEEFFDAVMTIGERQWSKIRDFMGTTRTGVQLKDRWRNMVKMGVVDKLKNKKNRKEKKKKQ